MRGSSAARDLRRMNRPALATGLGAASVLGLLALAALGSAGIAHPAAFPGAWYSPTMYREQTGCATSGATVPSWSIWTGVGHMKSFDRAYNCGAARSGPTAASSAFTESELAVTDPVTLVAHDHGVNVSWTLQLAGGDSVDIKTPHPVCPATLYSYNYNYGYTWYNFTYSYSLCEALGTTSVSAFAYLDDLTSGVSSYGNYWNGLSNTSGIENYSYYYTASYSNSSYWAYNYSYSYNATFNYGGAGTITGTYSPTFFLNGTFVTGHHYEVTTYVYAYAEAYEDAFTGGAASAHVNMQTMGHYLTFNKPVVW